MESIPLNDMFFRPDKLTPDSMEMLLRGMSQTVCKDKDGTLIDEVRNLLITAPDAKINMDLYALNVQRARDHGLEKFNYMRMAYGLPSLTSFQHMTGETQRSALLQNFYGNINQVDPWVGVLNEKPAEGGILGETAGRIVGSSLKRVRDGDSFWYEKILPVDLLEEVKRTSLAEVIMRNTRVLELQEDIFHHKKL